jgi:hypothetical protein
MHDHPNRAVTGCTLYNHTVLKNTLALLTRLYATTSLYK